MGKTVNIMSGVNVNKVKEQIKKDIQNLYDNQKVSSADVANENDIDIDGLQVNIGECKINLLAGLKRKPTTKDNTFQFDLTCGLKKKENK